MSKIFNCKTKRIDSEYYFKEYSRLDTLIRNNINKFISLADMKLEVNASAFYPSLEPFYNKGTIPFIRVADVKEFVNYDTCVNIPKMGINFETLYLCKTGDIVLTKGGTVGIAGLITRDSYVTRDLIFINSSTLSPKDYIPLYLYFRTEFMYRQMIKSSSLSVQPHLTITLIKELLIYNFSNSLKNELYSIYEKSEQYKIKSGILYKQAEELLNEYLQIGDISQEKAYTVKTLSKSYKQSGRLDAEYYQPKYDILFNALQGITTVNLGDIVKIKKSIEPGSEAYQDEGIPFIRVSDIDKFGISEPAIKLSHSVVPDIESLYPQKDTILLSKDGSIGIAYKVQENLQAVTSGALLHLTIKNKTAILPDYLTLVLNSQIVQLQAERDCNGAIIQHWKPSNIEKVVIPVIEIEKQKEIAEKVQESFRLRKESKRLLDSAIKAVEMAIETGEDTALQWLKEQNRK